MSSSTGVGGEGLGQSSEPASTGTDRLVDSKVPATNAGADDVTGGIAEGQGGVSKAAGVGATGSEGVAAEGAAGAAGGPGIMGTMKQYLGGVGSIAGFGGAGKGAASTDATTAAGGARSVDNAGLGADTAKSAPADTTTAAEGVHPTSTAASGLDTAKVAAGTVAGGAVATGAAVAGAAGLHGTKQNLDQTAINTQTAAGVSEPTTSEHVGQAVTGKDAATGAAEGESSAVTTSKELPASQSTPADTVTKDAYPSESGETKAPVGAGRDEHRETGAKAENKEAIPSAGGERLGEKHWGESKVVPDNPKPVEEETKGPGVSGGGQPSEQTKANTALNTGGAAAPGASSTATSATGAAKGDTPQKEKLIDRLKHKLHIGEKKK